MNNCFKNNNYNTNNLNSFILLQVVKCPSIEQCYPKLIYGANSKIINFLHKTIERKLALTQNKSTSVKFLS